MNDLCAGVLSCMSLLGAMTCPGPLADAATLLRKAAGLYQWLADDVLNQELVTNSLPSTR